MDFQVSGENSISLCRQSFSSSFMDKKIFKTSNEKSLWKKLQVWNYSWKRPKRTYIKSKTSKILRQIYVALDAKIKNTTRGKKLNVKCCTRETIFLRKRPRKKLDRFSDVREKPFCKPTFERFCKSRLFQQIYFVKLHNQRTKYQVLVTCFWPRQMSRKKYRLILWKQGINRRKILCIERARAVALQNSGFFPNKRPPSISVWRQFRASEAGRRPI